MSAQLSGALSFCFNAEALATGTRCVGLAAMVAGGGQAIVKETREAARTKPKAGDA